jgi:hypothetical protein
MADLAAFFRERGVNVVLMSEHVETLDPEKLVRIFADCRAYSTDSFLLVPGIEIDALNALFYDVQPVDSWTDPQDLATQFARGGALVAVSHPVKVKTDIPPLTASFVEGVEVWNSRHDGKLAIDGRIVRFWLELRRRLGRPLVPLCGIDFHKPSDFVPLCFEFTGDRLDRQTVVAALRNGRHRIVRAGQTVPLDFATGRLSAFYRMESACYRFAYNMVYRVHRVVLRTGIQPSKGLRSLLRRVF